MAAGNFPAKICSLGRCLPTAASASSISASVGAAYSAVTKPVEKRSQPGPDGEALQRFFAGVRAAGVNVAIAKALFTAGIRSPQQLMAASDRRLVAIRGVGPATVRKLRAQFG